MSGSLSWMQRGSRALRNVWRDIRILIGRLTSDDVVGTAYGVKMRANWQDRTFVLAYLGAYGTTLLNLLRDEREPFVFLDIGANQGLYSLIAAKEKHCVHAYAFEPVPATFQLLEDNIRLNDAVAKIDTLQFGVSDAVGEMQIFIKNGHSGAASLHKSLPGRPGETVQLRTAESFAATIEPANLPIFVKVDVEGHEHVVLAQLAGSVLASRIKSIFYEVDEKWSDPERLRGILAAAGFKTFTRFGKGINYDVLAQR